VNEDKNAGTYEATWNASGLQDGMYIANVTANDKPLQSIKINLVK
jgi:hypothetical protein